MCVCSCVLSAYLLLPGFVAQAMLLAVFTQLTAAHKLLDTSANTSDNTSAGHRHRRAHDCLNENLPSVSLMLRLHNQLSAA